MGKNYAKIAIKIGDIDIHIEGPYEFVSRHYEKVERQILSIPELIDEDNETDNIEVTQPVAPEVKLVSESVDSKQVDKKKRGRKPKQVQSENITQAVDAEPVEVLAESEEIVITKPKKQRERQDKDAFNFSMSFKDWLNRLPVKTTGTAKSVLAGYYIEYNNENHTFKAREVSKLLKTYNITLSNTSKFLKQGVDAQRMVEVSRNGKESEYMLTMEGINYVFKLLGVTDSVPEYLIPKI